MKLRCANCGRHVRMSDARCRSCCNRTLWWYIYIFIFVMIIFAGALYAFNELMKGAGLISRVNGGCSTGVVSTDTDLLHSLLPVPAGEEEHPGLRDNATVNLA